MVYFILSFYLLESVEFGSDVVRVKQVLQAPLLLPLHDVVDLK